MTLATRLAVMRAGRIEQLGAPLEVYRRPATSFVAGFVGEPAMNLLSCTVREGRLVFAGSQLFAPIASGEVVLGIRPENVAVGRGHELPIRFVERLGSETLVHLALDDSTLGEATLVASVPGEHAVRDEGALAVELPPQALHWFDAESGQRLA